jgi:5-methylcytosine-specific restriction endonuclease McrA
VFEFAGFVARNPDYALKKWRSLSSVRKALLHHRKMYPHCAWCGRTKDLQIHHIIPVSVNPWKADDPHNLITFCRKDHLRVAHNGNFKTRYTPDIKEVAKNNNVSYIID